MRVASEQIRSIRPGACALLLLPLGCSPVTLSMSTAPSADFSTRHTYGWEPNPQVVGALDNSIAGQEIRAAVDEALEARAFRPADDQPPDFLADYRVRLQSAAAIEDARWQIDGYHYTEGTLIVALLDPKSKRLLWRGAAQGAVDPSTSGVEHWQNIHTAVQQMFANFPSQASEEFQ
jgi:hypothetical protein